MYEVYGIYMKGEEVALYIGSTILGIENRFKYHLIDRVDRESKGGISKRTVERKDLFRKHVSGEITLEPRCISIHDNKEDMLWAEREEIHRLRPRLNVMGCEVGIKPSDRSKIGVQPETIQISLPDGGKETIIRRSKEAGCRSMSAYCAMILLDGKINKKTK